MRKNIIKKTIGLFMAVVLTFSTELTGLSKIQAAEEVDSFVVNGDFESGALDEWVIQGGNEQNYLITDRTEAFQGEHAVKIQSNQNSKYYSIRNTSYSLQPDTEYVLTYWVNVKELNEGGSAYFNMYQFEHTWEKGLLSDTGAQGIITQVTDGYQQVVYDFKTTKDTDLVQLDLSVNEGGIVYFDNVMIIPKPEEKMVNGDFETEDGEIDLSGWNAEGPLAESTINNHIEKINVYSCDFEHGEVYTGATSETEDDGNKYNLFTMSSSEQYTGISFETVPGITYKVSYKILVGEINGDPSIGLGFQEHNNGQDYALNNINYQTSTATDWITVEAEYKATKTNIDLFVQCYNGAATFAIDDVCVSYEKVKTETVVTNIAIYDFENGEGLFTSPNGAQAELSESVVHNGQKAMKVTHNTNWDAVQSTSVNVEVGKTYQFTYWVNIASADATPFCYSYALEGPEYTRVSFEKYAIQEVTGNWQKVEIEYTPQASPVVFTFELGNAKGTVYYDDICLDYVEQKELMPEVTEGVGAFGYDGGNALMIHSKADVYNYDTANNLVEGNTYSYSFWAKTTDTEEGFEFIPYVDNCTNGLITLNGYTTGDSEWTQYRGTFVAPAKSEAAGIRVGFYRRGTGTVYIDDFSITNVIGEDVHIHQGTWTRIEPVGNQNGSSTLTCDICGKTLYTEIIKAEVETPTSVEPTTKTPTTKPETPTSPTTKNPEPNTTKAATVQVAKVKIQSAKKAKKSAKVKISLKAVKKAKGYQIAIGKDRKCQKSVVKKFVQKAKVTITNKKLKKYKKLYVKARAYVLVGKNKKYGAWSKVKKITIK